MYTLLVNDKVGPVLRILAWLARQNTLPTPSKRLKRTIANACRHAERMATAQKQNPDLAEELTEAWSRFADHGSSTRWENEAINFAKFADFVDELLDAGKRAVRINLVQVAVALEIQTKGLFNAEIEAGLNQLETSWSAK